MKTETNGFVLLVAVIAAFGGFLSGYDSSVVADIRDQVTQQLSLSDWQWSQVVSSSLLGAVLSLPLSGLISDYFSRRNVLVVVAFGFILGTIVCARANSLDTLLQGRLLIGMCIGMASCITPLFIAEIAPARQRGLLLLVNGLAITVGEAVAFLSGYLLHDTSALSWRMLLWIGMIPAVVLFVGMFYAPHSPRWLLRRYGTNEARCVLTRIRSPDADIEGELQEMAAIPRVKTRWRQLVQTPVVFVLLVGIGLGVFQQLSGIGAIMYYGPVMFQAAGFSSVRDAILATAWMGLVNVVGTIITCVTVDRVGRRVLLLRGLSLAALSLLVTAVLFHCHLPEKPWAILFTLSCYMMGYCISVGSLFWVIVAEIYPGHVRGLAMSVATFTLWGTSFLVSLFFLQLFNGVGESMTFTLFAFFCLLAYVFVRRFVPETMGVSLEKIEQNLTAGKRMRDLGQPLDVVPAPGFAVLEESGSP